MHLYDDLDGMEGLSETSLGDPSVNHPNLFVKPVPPGWDEARLHHLFQAFGDIDSVRISHTTASGRNSVPHAFVRFKDIDAASAALNSLQGTVLEGVAVSIKLADSDMAPRIQSGLCASEWCYVRGLPPHLTKDDVATMFSVYGTIKDLKHFPSTESYKGSGALIQYESPDESSAAIQALNGFILPGTAQPLLVRYADSPEEKAAKQARKERQQARAMGSAGSINALNLQEKLQQQILELSLKTTGGLGLPSSTALGSNPTLAALAQVNPLHPPINVNGAWVPNINAPAMPNNNKTAHQGCSIYIKGLPEDADKLWLYEKFARFGGILSVRILIDEHTGHCNGIGFVNYTEPEGARAAHETMNGVSMGERLLHVMVQNNSGGGGGGGNGGGGRSRQHMPQMQQHAGMMMIPSQIQGGGYGVGVNMGSSNGNGGGGVMPDYLNSNAW